MTAFISYSHADRSLAKRFAAALREFDLDHWWDERIALSSPWNTALQHHLDNATCIVTLWTRHSVASEWVVREASHGMAQSKLVQIRVGAAELPKPFSELQAADVPVWEESTFPRGIRSALNTIAQLQAKPSVLADHERILRLNLSWKKVMRFVDGKKHHENYFPKLDGTLFKDIWEMSMDERIKLYDELRPGSRSHVDEERYYELIEYLSDRGTREA